MLDVLCGCLLGNGIFHSNGQFFIRLKESKKKYIYFLNKKILGTPVREVIDSKFSKKYFYFYSKDKFLDLRKQWYNKDKKIIPENFEISTEALAHWYIQDGYLHDNYSILYTSNFTKEEVEFLQFKVEETLSLKFSIIKNRKFYWLRIGKDIPILEIINPYLGNCCYKFKHEKIQRKRLSDKDKDKIKSFYEFLNKTQSELAKEFGVSQSYINKIINDEIELKDNFKIEGQAIVDFN